MKSKTLFFSSLGAIFFFTFTSIINYFVRGIHTLPIYLILAPVSIFFGYFFYKSWSKKNQSIAAPWLDEDPELEGEIMDRALMNHFINKVIADGGVGYLLSDRFIFIPHKFGGKEGKRLEILFVEIKNLTDFKYCKIVDTGVVITLFNGKEERFVIDKTTNFYSKLKSLRL